MSLAFLDGKRLKPGNVFSTNCPGAPRLEFLAGRPNATFPADDNTVPLPQSDVTTILDRMEDAGFTAAEVIHLLASHSIARSDTLVPGHEAVPFDSSPFTFDTQVFLGKQKLRKQFVT